MFKKLNKMKIGARLKKSFRQIILIFGILSALVVVIMLYTINNYGTILDNYAYPQGDIAMAMNESAEVRAASRGIVGYDSDSLIESISPALHNQSQVSLQYCNPVQQLGFHSCILHKAGLQSIFRMVPY